MNQRKSPLLLRLIVCGLLALPLTLPTLALDAKSEADFLTRIEKAIVTKDVAAWHAFTWTKNVPDEFAAAAKAANADALGKVIATKELLPLEEGDAATIEFDGNKYVPTPKPVKRLKLTFKKTGAADESDLTEITTVVGEHEGQLYFCMPTPVK